MAHPEYTENIMRARAMAGTMATLVQPDAEFQKEEGILRKARKLEAYNPPKYHGKSEYLRRMTS